MSAADLDALAARVEEAPGPDRELDELSESLDCLNRTLDSFEASLDRATATATRILARIQTRALAQTQETHLG